MSKFQISKSKAIISLILVLSLIFNVIPFNILSTYAGEKLEKQKTQQVITKEDLKANQYETYYYTDEIEYVYNDQVVEFVSESKIKVGEETLNLKNKKIEVTTKVEDNNVDISFTNLQIPIGSVSGQWNSSFGGDYYISYKSDIPGMEKVKSSSANLKSISLTNLPAGEYNLTNGSIYEAANEWSPGIEGIGTSGNFGKLPNIKIKINNNENSEKEKVKISIEKRTIGKGDTLSLQSVDYQVNDTAWDVLKRIADENDISIEYSGSGDNIYVSSIDRDGEFDHGSGSGWKYQVNGEFPEVSLGSYKLKANDEIRLRYCVTVKSEELTKPLVEYLKTVVAKATNTLNKGNYTSSSKQKLQSAINEANKIIEDEKYNTTNTEEELVVSKHIGNINSALDSLEESDGTVEDDINNVPNDFENDLWLQYDFKEMKIGDKADIYPRRIPQIVGSSINNDVHRPNFNFEIVQGDSIELSTNDSNEKSIVTAKKEGTTIVKVTYDETVYKNKTYGASSLVNSAYVIFDVRENETDMSISTNINQSSYDTIYFANGNSTNLDFTVNATNAKSVKVTCNNEELSKVNGKYRAKLKNRSNIIGIVATNEAGETKTYYKVVDARKIEIDIYNKSNPNDEIVEGDTVEISFKGISNPVAKLATLYNPTWHSEAFGNKGTFVEYNNDKTGVVKGYCDQWDLATNNTITVKLDKAGTYDFINGRIFSQWWGSTLGEDKKVQGEGAPNLAADTNERYFSQMPDFSIDVKAKKDDEVKVTGIKLFPSTLEIKEGLSRKLSIEVSPIGATNKNVKWTSSDENILTVNEDGTIKAINSGQAVVTATSLDGSNVKGECSVTVIGQEFIDLRNEIKNLKNLNEENYEKEDFAVFKAELDKAENILNDISSTKEDLKNAKIALKKARNTLVLTVWEVSVEPEVIKPGTEVAVKLPNMKIPTVEGIKSISTYYDFNMEGFDSPLRSEDGISNNELAKTIKFAVPKNTKTGTYQMTNGYVATSYQTSTSGGMSIHYQYEMPDIDIIVQDESEEKPEVTPIDVIKMIQHASVWELASVTNPTYEDEWDILGLVRGDIQVPNDYYKTYYNNLVEVVKNKKGNLSSSKYSEYSRVIIALTALGYDPTDVGGYNLVEKLYNFKNVSKQGINGVIFALIALDTKDFPIEGNENSRDKMINFILENQLSDGGFALSGDKGEVDITAMALQALANYKDNEKVKTAIEKALNFLSKSQLETGGFKAETSFFTNIIKFITNDKSVEENVESAAQVLVAMNALGIDNSDERFVKNGNTIAHNIMTFQVEDGGYKHISSDTSANAMATEQVLYSLVSQKRLENKKTSLYDMSDVTEVKPEEPEVPEQPETNEAPVITASDVELKVGDKFDPRANVKATDKEDGDITKNIKVVENTVDTSKEGSYKVVYEVKDSKGLKATKEIAVIVKAVVVEPEVKKLKVGIYSDEKPFYESVEVDYKKGDTPYTVLKRLLGDKVETSGQNDTLYVESINGLAEFDKGAQSGWVYSVNRSMPQVSAGMYELKPGDELIWHYTLNLGKDITNSYDKFDEFVKGENPEVPEQPETNEAPVITASDIELKVGDKFEPMSGVSASDKEDGDITKNIKIVENTVDTSKEGTYKVVYEVKDSKGLKTKKEIKVLVVKEIEVVDVAEMIKNASAWELANVTNPTYTDEWDILGLVRGDIKVPSGYYETYYKNLVKAVKEKDGNLSSRKYTEYSRVIIALSALGYDATDVGGYNLVEKLYNFDDISKQGINGVIFALIALDTNDFEIKGDLNSREMMINYILENQLKDGGFALSGDKSEVDITAMALQALANYKDEEKVKVAVEKALNFLSKSQLGNGGFGSEEGENVESSSQVLVAINSLGISARDERFVKNGKTIVDAMKKFEVKDGGYKHLLTDKKVNDMATEQALYALVSQERLNEGKTSLYDMSDVKGDNTNKPGTDSDEDNDTDKPGIDDDQDNDTDEPGIDSDEDGGNDNNQSPSTSDKSVMPFVFIGTLAMAAVLFINRKKLS